MDIFPVSLHSSIQQQAGCSLSPKTSWGLKRVEYCFSLKKQQQTKKTTSVTDNGEREEKKAQPAKLKNLKHLNQHDVQLYIKIFSPRVRYFSGKINSTLRFSSTTQLRKMFEKIACTCSFIYLFSIEQSVDNRNLPVVFLHPTAVWALRFNTFCNPLFCGQAGREAMCAHWCMLGKIKDQI